MLIGPVGDLAEGIYMASGAEGDDCFTVTARIHQTPETGRGDYRIQVDAKHNANHNSNYHQRLVLQFNQPVEYVSSNGQLHANNGNILEIDIAYWQNHTDNIGMGDVIVRADSGLAIVSAAMLDLAKQ